MRIFPEVANQYMSKNDPYPMARFSDFIRQSLQVNQSWWVAANLDQRYEAGDQQIWQQYYNAWQVRANKQFTFNIIRSQVATYEGYQRANRKTTICVPRENGNQDTADQFTDIFLWLNQQENLYETISTAFRGALITGLSLIETWMDFRRDPINGEIKFTVCPYNSICIDPFWTKPDFSDCNGVAKRSFVTPLEAASYLPDHRDAILTMDGFGPAEATFQFMPENYQFAFNNLLTYDEFYYPAMRKQRLVVDTKTGETREWRLDNDAALRAFLAEYPELKVVMQEIPTTRLSIIVQGQLMFDGPQPNGCDEMPFTPVYAYLNPELEDFTLRWAGIVRSLRDVQFLFNHRKVLEMQSNESVAQAGWLVEEDAVVNPEDLYKPQPGQVIYAKKGRLDKVTKIPASPIDPSWQEASQALLDLSNKITNVSETFMGQSTDAISGFHEQQKTATNLIASQRLFDQLDTAQRILGNKVLSIIQNNWTPGKIQRIIKKQPSAEFYDKTFGRYDCQVELGFDTATQKQMQLLQLVELTKLGLNIPKSALINAATLQNKTELLQQMEAEGQAMQQQMMQKQQLEMVKLQAEIDMASAQAQVQRANSVEKISEIQNNEADAVHKRSLALKEQQQGNLDLIKAAKEIDSVTLDQFVKLVGLAKTMKDVQRVEEEDAKKRQALEREEAEARVAQQREAVQPEVSQQQAPSLPEGTTADQFKPENPKSTTQNIKIV